MRVKVDEDLPVEVATALREAGHDAPTVLDQEETRIRIRGGSD